MIIQKVVTSYMDQSNLKILNYMLNGKFQLEVIVVYFIIFKKGTGFLDTAPEYQIIDDLNYASLNDLTEDNIKLDLLKTLSTSPTSKTASDYAMYPALMEKNSIQLENGTVPQ